MHAAKESGMCEHVFAQEDEKPTVGTDPDLADRAEQLKQRLGG